MDTDQAIQEHSGDSSQLSLTVLSQESLGVKNQVWDPLRAKRSGPDPELLTLDWLRVQPDLPLLVQLIPAQKLYLLLKREGLDEAEEVIEWLRGDQLVRVFDYELWKRPAQSSQDPFEQFHDVEISCVAFVEWLRVWNQISPEFAAERFLELEEETIVLICNALFEIVPVGLENGVQGSDEYLLTPDTRFYIKTKSKDADAEDLSYIFARSIFGVNMALASRVFAYAAMLVRAESEVDALNLRAGRLADNGFVSREEALSLLKPRSLSSWNSKYQDLCRENESKVVYFSSQLTDASDLNGADDDVDPELFDRVHAFWKLLSKDEYLTEARLLIGEEGLKELTGIDDPPGYLLENDDQVRNLTTDKAIKRSLKKLQQVALLEISRTALQSDVNQSSMLIDHVLRQISHDDIDKTIQIKERMARQANAISSLMDDPAAEDAQIRALSIFKGTLNLGLHWLTCGAPSAEEFVLLNCAEHSLEPASMKSLTESVQPAQEILLGIGIERVFQAGLDLLHGLSIFAAQKIEATIALNPKAPSRSLSQLVAALRFAELRDHLFKIEEFLEPGQFLLASSLLNRFAFYPVGLSLGVGSNVVENSTRLTRATKVFETPAEFARAWQVLNLLSSTLHRNKERDRFEQTEIH